MVNGVGHDPVCVLGRMYVQLNPRVYVLLLVPSWQILAATDM